MDVLINFLFYFEVLFLVFLEKKMWDTFYTPFFFLAVPFTVVWTLAIVVAKQMGFIAPYSPALFIWIVGLFFFWLPSLIINLYFKSKGYSMPSFKFDKSFFLDNKFDLLIVILSALISLLFIYRFNATLGLMHISKVGTEDFGELFVGKGFWGHLRISCIPLLIYLIVSFRKKWFLKAIIIGILFAVFFLYQVKGSMLIVVVSSIALVMWLKDVKINIWYALLIVVIGISVFFFSYYVILVLGGKSKVSPYYFNWLQRHFYYYFLSGVLGLSRYVESFAYQAINPEVLFAPVINLFSFATGNDLINPVNHIMMYVGNSYKTNVFTFFGTIYFYSGVKLGILFSFIIGGAYYSAYILFIMFKNIWLLIALFFLIGLLAMGWFEYYLFHLFVIEVPVFCFILSFLFPNQKIKNEVDNG